MQDPALDLDLDWLPYELNDDTPPEGIALAEYYGVSQRKIGLLQASIKRRAAEVGLPYNAPELICSTRKAHLLGEYARAHGQLAPLHRALFRAHFVDGRNLADDDVLGKLAEEVGLDPRAALAALDDPGCEEAFTARLRGAAELGITSVPTFLVDGRYSIVGAQPYTELRDTLLRIAAGVI